jgi:hypothetical protein
MDPSQVNIPILKDLTIDNITENVHLINSPCPDPRLKYILERLVTHLHEFARETRLSTGEWMKGIEFLTETGKICTNVRQVCLSLSPPFLLRLSANIISLRIGIHPPLRHPRPLPLNRLNRPPETPPLNRRHSPRSLPHPRCHNSRPRFPNPSRPHRYPPPRPLHGARHRRKPNSLCQNRRLGN